MRGRHAGAPDTFGPRSGHFRTKPAGVETSAVAANARAAGQERRAVQFKRCGGGAAGGASESSEAIGLAWW